MFIDHFDDSVCGCRKCFLIIARVSSATYAGAAVAVISGTLVARGDRYQVHIHTRIASNVHFPLAIVSMRVFLSVTVATMSSSPLDV